MSAKAQIVGIDGIMDWYDQHCTSPYYAVYTYLAPTKLEKHFQYTKPDMEEGRMLLENTLQAMYMQNDDTLYCLKLYDTLNKKSSIDGNLDNYASVRIRVVDLPHAQPIAGVERSNYKLENALARMMETQNLILTKLNAAELEEIEEEKPEGIAGILSDPNWQPLIMAGLSKFLGIGNVPPAAMAGVEDGYENEAILILNNLMQKGVTIDHLKKLNEMSNAKLQSLLLML
jgi:hypothetical protein